MEINYTLQQKKEADEETGEEEQKSSSIVSFVSPLSARRAKRRGSLRLLDRSPVNTSNSSLVSLDTCLNSSISPSPLSPSATPTTSAFSTFYQSLIGDTMREEKESQTEDRLPSPTAFNSISQVPAFLKSTSPPASSESNHVRQPIEEQNSRRHVTPPPSSSSSSSSSSSFSSETTKRRKGRRRSLPENASTSTISSASAAARSSGMLEALSLSSSSADLDEHPSTSSEPHLVPNQSNVAVTGLDSSFMHAPQKLKYNPYLVEGNAPLHLPPSSLAIGEKSPLASEIRKHAGRLGKFRFHNGTVYNGMWWNGIIQGSGAMCANGNLFDGKCTS